MFLKNLKVALLSLLALAAAVTVGCGGGGAPAFTKLSFNSQRNGTNTTLFLMNLDGTSVTPATNGPDSSYSPSVSANAKKIVYVSNENVWSMNSDGSANTQLTSVTDDQSDNF